MEDKLEMALFWNFVASPDTQWVEIYLEDSGPQPPDTPEPSSSVSVEHVRYT